MDYDNQLQIGNEQILNFEVFETSSFKSFHKFQRFNQGSLFLPV